MGELDDLVAVMELTRDGRAKLTFRADDGDAHG